MDWQAEDQRLAFYYLKKMDKKLVWVVLDWDILFCPFKQLEGGLNVSI